jgi:hypothetical protein
MNIRRVHMLDLREEQRSLDAINKLEAEYPYAASMLAYLVLELFLKLHLLKYRKTLTDKEVEIDESLRKAKDLDDTSFIESFLTRLPLGRLERVYRIPEKRYSKDRNDVFHSNLYLANQLGNDYQSRVAQNRAYLETAKKHLVEASELYFPQWRIVELKGQLQFRS